MEPSIYSFSLCSALPLMLFFGFYFLFAKTPEKKIFKNYLRSRQIMGIAMLLLSIFNFFRSCVVSVAKRNHAKNLFICFSCLVSRFWSRFSSQSHSCIS